MPVKDATAGRDYQEADALFSIVAERLKAVRGHVDEGRLRQAYELALTAHEGQTRRDGSPYILHPLEVAEICVSLNMDEDSIVAALLHDAVEDTPGRLNQIGRLSQVRQLFGQNVGSMVDALTKIKRIDFFARFTGRNKASEQARNMQKLFIAMTRDTRVIVIKLADRLHNMQTLTAMPEDKRSRISRETMEFYVPIARRLGLGEMVGELEDLVFQHLMPEEYSELCAELGEVFPRLERSIEEMIQKVREIMERGGVTTARVFGRRKHLYSIYRKLQKLRRQHRAAAAAEGAEPQVSTEQIFDLMAIRIIVDGPPVDCYRALGLLHLHFRPIFERFRDFIASPKDNGYQTLHTTVFNEEGRVIECQIRTVEMDRAASQGIAAHWRYKEVAEASDFLMKDEAWNEFIRELSSEALKSVAFVGQTRDAFLGDQVIVLSPKNEVVSLPVGSTPIDFAYYIHTNLGHAIRGAKVNGSVVPLDYELRNGDLVEVVKAAESDAAPRPEWLVMAKSPHSLMKVRRYFRARPRAERVAVGRQLLRQHILRSGLYPLNLTANDNLVELLRRLPVRSIDELYDKVAQGAFRCDEIVDELKAIHRSRIEHGAAQIPAGAKPLANADYGLAGLAGELGIELAGGQALRRKVALMVCCTPVPGDSIYGINDREQRRVEVHRVDCEQLKQKMNEGELLDLHWTAEPQDLRYPARIRVISLDRVGLLFEILKHLSARNINLSGLNQPLAPRLSGVERSAQFEMTIEVADRAELDGALAAVAEMNDVFEAVRVIEAPEAPAPEGPR